jgi:HEPN domain-containing protein
MNIDDVMEWIQIADEDLYSAQMLNELVRKPYETICYHCAQALEKYLKGYLTYNNIIPQKTHNLLALLELCVEKDNSFESIRSECGILNRFTNEIRYPHRIEIKIEDVNYALNAMAMIRDFEPIQNLRILVIQETEKEIEINKNSNEDNNE